MRSQIIAIAVWLGAAGSATAACDVSLTNFGVDPIASYDPFSTTPAATTAPVTLFNPDASPCPVSIALTPGNPSFELGGSLGARFLGPGAVATHGFTQTVNAPPGTSIVSFSIELPAGQVMGPGVYSVLLTASLLDENGPSQQRAAEFSASVAARAEVGVANGGGAWNVSQFGTIDLGTLTTGETGQAFIQVRANTLTSISVGSQSSSALVRTNATAADAPIPFTVTLDAVPIAIAAGTAQIQRMPAATLAGSIYTLEVRIGTVGQHYAGQYTGTVEIDVTPQP